jgi:hypothetical protein
MDFKRHQFVPAARAPQIERATIMTSNRNLIATAATACLIVALIASVGLAESELSTAPLDHVEYPEARPDWIVAEPDLKSRVHTWVVNADDCESRQQCEAKLQPLMRAAVELYVNELTGWECEDALIDELTASAELVQDRYEGQYTQGDSERHEVAVRLAFDAATREKIRQAARDVEVGERLRATAGLFALAVFGLFLSSGILNVWSRRVS